MTSNIPVSRLLKAALSAMHKNIGKLAINHHSILSSDQLNSLQLIFGSFGCVGSFETGNFWYRNHRELKVRDHNANDNMCYCVN